MEISSWAGYTSVMAKHKGNGNGGGVDFIVQVLERVEGLEQSMEALEKGATGALTTLATELRTGLGAMRKETASLASALRAMAEHQRDRFADHEARLRKLEELLG